MTISKQLKEFYKTFSRHGNGDSLVQIEPKDIVLLIHIAYMDLNDNPPKWFIKEYYFLYQKKDFFSIMPNDISDLPNVTIEQAVCLLQLCKATDTNKADFRREAFK